MNNNVNINVNTNTDQFNTYNSDFRSMNDLIINARVHNESQKPKPKQKQKQKHRSEDRNHHSHRHHHITVSDTNSGHNNNRGHGGHVPKSSFQLQREIRMIQMAGIANKSNDR